MLSVIMPAYNERDSIAPAAAGAARVLDEARIDFELVFVDDGSLDGTWDEILSASERDGRVRGVRFSRNFGKEAALLAGLKAAKGECCVTLDCDLQHPPEKMVEMYRLWEQGYEVVEGLKADRGKENPFYSLCAKAFYGVMSRAAGFDMRKASDFKLLDRKAVDALLSLPERGTFYRALSNWIGFKTAAVYYEVAPRVAGESKWSAGRLIKYAVSRIASFTSSPLQLVTALGVVMLAIALVLGIQTLVRKLSGHAAEGFTTVIIVVLLTGSIIMVSLGIIGYYLARMYDELKGRPRYIVSEETKEKKEK